MVEKNRRALGRGLDALLPAAPQPAGEGAMQAFIARIEDLHPRSTQPRTRFDEALLDELAESIKSVGLLEPILVRRRASGGGYEIIAGERRWRASQRAGVHEVPVLVRELSEQGAFEAALVENLQREDLNPLETARAFQRLIDEHGHNQESLAKLIGKNRSTVANALRLLKLPEDVLDRIESGALSEGHGRALLGAGSPAAVRRLAREAIHKGWSVRETERRARQTAAEGRDASKQHAKGPEKSPNVRDLEARLSRSLGARTTVSDRKGKGQLTISFTSYDELDRLLEILMR